MLKIISVKAIPAFYRSPGEEVEPGDEATIFLNQTHNSDLPLSIDGTILTVSDTLVYTGGCPQNAKLYTLQYDSDNLPGNVSELAECDVISVAGTSCCESLRADLTELNTEVESISADLDTWDMQTFSGVPTNGSPGVPQVETQTAVGTITADGTLFVTVTGAGIAGSPLQIPFNVEAGDVPSVWAAKAAAVMATRDVITELYTPGSIGADFALTEVSPDGNDGTLNIAIAAGTATGITPDATSTNTVAGVSAVSPLPTPARVGQRGRFGNRVWTAINLYEWVEEVNEFNGIVDYGFTDQLGGTSIDLDSLAVSSAQAGHMTFVNNGSALYPYELIAGTTAESSPDVVRPDNYAGGTNEFIWSLRPVVTKSAFVLDASAGPLGSNDASKVVLFGFAGDLSASVQIQVKSIVSGYSWQVVNDNLQLTATRIFTPPNASGTGALYQTVVATTPTAGNTINGAVYVDQTHYITPAGTLATLTFTLPTSANARLGQVVKLWFTQIITALTVNVSGGGTILGTALTAAVVNTPYEYECVSTTGTGTWVRRQ